MNKYVLDSSALLAVINEEAGASTVEKLLNRSVVSAVNLSETIGRLSLEGVPPDEALSAITDMVQGIVSFDRNIALLAGRLRPRTQALGLSLGDRACLATAEYLKLEAVTADKAWGKLPEQFKIRVIR